MSSIAPQISSPFILVVEDDRFVRELVEVYLTAEGYRVIAVADGIAMRTEMAKQPVDLVIMDLKLPGEDGLSLTRYLREHYDVGIVIVTTRNDAVDRVVGLDCGADDYVTKPFDQRELLARIRSVLRRAGSAKAGPHSLSDATNLTTNMESAIVFHGYRLNPSDHELTLPSGEKIELTSNESRLLSYLARNSGRIMSRDLLMDLVLQRSRDPLDRSIDVLVTRVRRKIETDPRRPALIKTVRGSGYVIPQENAVSAA